MTEDDHLRRAFEASLSGAGDALAAADQLCSACVELLDVDGAAISLTYKGTTHGTYGSSGALSRHLDELQFTLGEGPCLEATALRRPVMVADLDHPDEQRWPAFASAVLGAGVRAVFAIPSTVAASQVGVLDLFRKAAGPLSADELNGGLLAAQLAALPLLELLHANSTWDHVVAGTGGSSPLSSLERVEVYQATGMLMAQLDVGPAEALVRLRAHAFAQGTSASEVAWAIVERRLTLDADDAWRDTGAGGKQS